VALPLVYRAHTFSRRRTEGEDVRGHGRRAYGASLDGGNDGMDSYVSCYIHVFSLSVRCR
jgi:hypothetical protein